MFVILPSTQRLTTLKKMKQTFIFFAFLSFLSAENGKVPLIDLHYVIAPAPNFQYASNESGNNRDYTFGLSFPVPKKQNFRFGIDIMLKSWTAYRLYRFEQDLLYENQSVGNTDELFEHSLLGAAPYLSGTINNKGDFWDKATFSFGVLAGHPDTPNKVWLKKWGKITDRIVFTPFLRLERPLIAKYPWIIGMAQFYYVPGAGLVSSLLIGADVRLW